MPLNHRPASPGRLSVSAWLLLALSLMLALLWSHTKLLSQDEFFVLQTDSVRTLHELLQVQLHVPISLDPLAYHLAGFLGCRLLGPGALAIRLPSIVGFLLLQLCLYVFVRRVAGEAAGLLAQAFPAISATFFYAVEARPYGMLLGLLGLVAVLWQGLAARADLQTRVAFDSDMNYDPTAPRTERSRVAALAGLALAVGVLLNTHYFAILLLIPLYGAEVARTFERRRVGRSPDWPVLAALAAGTACFGFALPFSRAAAEFRVHYYNAGVVTTHAITQGYRSLLLNYTHASPGVQRLTAGLLVVSALLFLAGLVWRRRALALTMAEFTLLVLLAALPVFGWALARFVTHSFEVRYVLGAIFGLASLLAVLLAPWLRSPGLTRSLPWLLGVIVLTAGLSRLDSEHLRSEEILLSLRLSPEVRAAVASSPSQRLYLQDLGAFEVASYYEPDAGIRDRLTLVYSRPEELAVDHHDTGALTAMHMGHFTGFAIVPYEAMRQTPGEQVFAVFHSGWDWTDAAFAAPGVQVRPLGPALGGDGVAVRFEQARP